MVMGAYYLFAERITWEPLLVSLPMAFLILSVIFCNEIPDFEEDRDSGKNNLIGAWGRDKGYQLYAVSVLLSVLSLLALIYAKILPGSALLILGFYILAIKPLTILKTQYTSKEHLHKASGMTIALYTFVGIAMTGFLFWM